MKYETNRKWLLIFGGVLIGYCLLGISYDGPIPFTDIKLKDPAKINVVLFLLVAYFTIFTAYTWFRLPKQERSFFDLIVCLIVSLLAIVPTSLNFLRDLGFTWVNLSVGLLLLLVGIIFGITLDFIVMTIFSLRSTSEIKHLGLGRVPTAAKAFLRTLVFFLFPIDILIIIGIVLIRSYYPETLFTYWWAFILGALLCIDVEQISNLFLCLGPASVRKAAISRLKLFRGAMDLHEMHYQHIGIEPHREYEGPAVCQLAKVGQAEELEEFISKGVDPNKQDGRGWSPLMWASAEGHLEIVELLLAHGADPNSENYLGRTALMYSSMYGYIDIVKVLVAHGANIKPAQEFGAHPPLLAAAQHGHHSVVSFLIEEGVDVSHKNKEGKTALDLAMESGHGELAKTIRNAMRKASDEKQNSKGLTRSLEWIKKELKSD